MTTSPLRGSLNDDQAAARPVLDTPTARSLACFRRSFARSLARFGRCARFLAPRRKPNTTSPPRRCAAP